MTALARVAFTWGSVAVGGALVAAGIALQSTPCLWAALVLTAAATVVGGRG